VTLTEPGYRERLADRVIERDLRIFGAVAVEGPRWCGKTWTCLNHASSAFFVADPQGAFANRALAELDPSGVLAGARPRLIDEWQEVPPLWDAVRHAVDRGHDRGLVLLSGSTAPPRAGTVHSGAGRIARRRMRPMALVESGDSSGTAALTAIAEGEPLAARPSAMTLDRVLELVTRGGWPAAIDLPADEASVIARSYIDTLIHTDLPALNGVAREPGKLGALLRSLARNTATTVSQATLRRDAAGEDGAGPSRESVSRYLDELRRVYVLDEFPAWSPGLRSRTRLRTAPKSVLADPSLAVAALGATRDTLRADLTTLGFVFESLCLRDLGAIADAAGWSASHYRDETGLEADAILALPDGRWVGVEIKLGFTQVDKAAANLAKLSARIAAGGGPAAAALVVIVGVGSFAHTRPDGVHIVPIDHLGL
jgi:predicted AAA+ superfamily ATPase